MNIRERILARSNLDGLRAAREITGLAAALNAEGLTALTETWVDALGIMNRCASGKSILRKLAAGAEVDPVISVAWKRLSSGKGLDFGAASTLESIDEMAVALGFAASEVDDLKMLAVRPVVVTQEQVGNALYYPDGTER